jgi:hypothetical protein
MAGPLAEPGWQSPHGLQSSTPSLLLLPLLAGHSQRPHTGWAAQQQRRPARQVHASAAADSGTWSEGGASSSAASADSRAPPAGFANLEKMIVSQLGGGPGGEWKELEGCWVLYPPEGATPRCLVHFIGGSFVGAAPQLAYRPLLEALSARGALVRGVRGWADKLTGCAALRVHCVLSWLRFPSCHCCRCASKTSRSTLLPPAPLPPHAADSGGALRHLL